MSTQVLNFKYMQFESMILNLKFSICKIWCIVETEFQSVHWDIKINRQDVNRCIHNKTEQLTF
jgi:hypothetical protein